MEMHEALFVVGIVCAIASGGFLVASIAMFFGFDVPSLSKSSSGKLEQKQIEEIRRNSSGAVSQRRKVNVFEDLEKKAGKKMGASAFSHESPSAAPISQKRGRTIENGTTVLNQNANVAHPDFVIEKNIMFVSTNEVM